MDGEAAGGAYQLLYGSYKRDIHRVCWFLLVLGDLGQLVLSDSDIWSLVYSCMWWVFWRGRVRGVDDDGSSKTPLFAQKRKEVLCRYVVLLHFFCKGLRRVMCVLDSSIPYPSI